MSLIALPRAGLQAIVAGILGIDTTWATDPQNMTSPVTQASATLNVSGRRMIGWDEERESFAPGSPGTLTTEKSGLRSFALSVKVESFNTAIGYADDYLDTLVTRLWWDSQIAACLALNVAIQDVSPISVLPTNYDNRVVSAASVDLMCGWAFDDVTDASAQGWIDTVLPTGTGSPGANQVVPTLS